MTTISPSSRRTRNVTTAVVFYSTFTLGSAFVFLSPTVIDFSEKFGTSVDQVSVVFTVSTVSYVFGTLLCGIASAYFSRHIIIIILMLTLSFALILTPVTPTLTLFFVVNAFLGFCCGGNDTTQIAWIMEIWRNDCPAIVFGQNFAFAIGTVLPPILLAPFLTDDDGGGGGGGGAGSTNQTMTMATETRMNTHGNLFLPFTVGGSVLGSAALAHIFLFIYLQKRPPFSWKGEEREGGEKEPLLEQEDRNQPVTSNDLHTISSENKKEPTRLRKIVLIILSCLVISFYVAVELTTMRFLPTFSVYSTKTQAHPLSEADGSKILFALTMAFAIARALGILIVYRVSSEAILFWNFVLMAVANVILQFFAHTSIIALWTASILMGVGLSTVFPCYYAFIEKHLHVSDAVSAIILVVGGAVTAVYPVVVGKSMEIHPVVLCYVNSVSIGASMAAFGLTYYLTL